MECEFCKKTYPSQARLVSHQKTSKGCMKIRGIVHESSSDQKENSSQPSQPSQPSQSSQPSSVQPQPSSQSSQSSQPSLVQSQSSSQSSSVQPQSSTQSSQSSSSGKEERSSEENEIQYKVHIIQLEAKMKEKDNLMLKLLQKLEENHKYTARLELKLERLEEFLGKIIKQSQEQNQEDGDD
jgi:hypothetical protein